MRLWTAPSHYPATRARAAPREDRRRLAASGRSPRLIKYTPGVTVGELAADERVSTAAMSKRVSRLERDGLVTRTQSEKDRRQVGLTLTDEGQRTLRRVRSRRTAWLASRLDRLFAAPSSPRSAPPSTRSRICSPTRKAADERLVDLQERTFVSLPLSELPPLLRGPAHVPDRLVDAADRARLVHPRAHDAARSPARFAGRGRLDGVRAVPAVHALRPLRRRDHRPVRRPPPRARDADRPDSSRRSPSRGSPSPASRSRGCST